MQALAGRQTIRLWLSGRYAQACMYRTACKRTGTCISNQGWNRQAGSLRQAQASRLVLAGLWNEAHEGRPADIATGRQAVWQRQQKT